MDIVESLPGSAVPSDLFEPHMPGVDVLSDMPAFFADLRRKLRREKDERHVAIVTPGRMTTFVPVPARNKEADQDLEQIEQMLPSDRRLDISVISYTKLEALTQDETKTQCIPFLDHLVGFAYAGHCVIVFEGHRSALPAGVLRTDVLLVDSGMIPFLQEDWVEVSLEAMRSGARILGHDRERYRLLPIGRSRKAPGWQYSAPDGEASYANCLLTTLAKASGSPAKLVSGSALPDLAPLTRDPDELDWIYGLPFALDKLNADEVIEIIQGLAGWSKLSFFKTQGVLDAQLALKGDRLQAVSFDVVSSKEADGRKAITITKR